MNRAEYRAYLRSDHWQRTRRRILTRANAHCEWCGRFCGVAVHHPDAWCGLEECAWCAFYFDATGEPNDRERQRLDVHHLTYDRVGAERDDDLVALCWSCHDGVTDRMMELKALAKAGRIPRSEATPVVASRRFWAVFLRAIGLGRDR